MQLYTMFENISNTDMKSRYVFLKNVKQSGWSLSFIIFIVTADKT